MMWMLRGALTIGMVGVVGCAVGPDYRAPDVHAPAAWESQLGHGLNNAQSTLSSWWMSFNDAELNSLIQRAVRSNLDVRVAEARLRQARALREGSIANFMPAVDSTASFAKAQQSKNQPLIGALPLPPSFSFDYNVYEAGFDASWEIDVFGGKRRALEASTDEWEGLIEARNNVIVSLLGEVARTYVELRGSQARLKIAKQALALQEEMLGLTRDRSHGGVVSELDVVKSASLLAGLKAAIPPLNAAIRGSMHGLAVLISLDPGDLIAELSLPMGVPPAPAEVPIGLPSELIRRRPDVRRAERQLAAETARIGVAESDWYPKFSLTGDVGLESVSRTKWFEPGSVFWSFGPSFQWRIFDFGRVRAEVQAQTAVQEAALATYEKTVLTSLQEAEDALVAYAQEQNRHRALVDKVAQDRDSLDLVSKLYSGGRISYLDVLDVRLALSQSEDLLAMSDQAISLGLIALYKALGGGWDAQSGTPARAPSSPPSP